MDGEVISKPKNPGRLFWEQLDTEGLPKEAQIPAACPHCGGQVRNYITRQYKAIIRTVHVSNMQYAGYDMASTHIACGNETWIDGCSHIQCDKCGATWPNQQDFTIDLMKSQTR